MLLTDKYADKIYGIITCYDRMIIQRYIPNWSHADSMTANMKLNGIRIFDYPVFSQPLTEQVWKNAEKIARDNGIEIEFIRKLHAFRKDDRVQKIISETGKTDGLVHIFSAMECCNTYKPWHDKTTGKTFLKFDQRKCLHYYFYFIDRELGLCYLRVPTWPPFRLQFYMNGHNLKVGRVQTPTLAMLVDREAKIMNFQKETYYMAHILMDGIDAATGRIDDKKKADEIAGACQNGQALTTSVVKEEKTVMPPKLYDLTTLQRDANRLFGFTAKQTLEYTQSLYEKKLATYLRTDSQFLSDDMGQTAEGVIEAVFHSLMFEENKAPRPDIKRILNSKKVTDHHAIIPTMEIAKADLAALPETERKILSLVAKRLLCATGEKHLYETVKAEFSCNGHTFAVSGKSVTHNGWKSFEDAFKRSFKISGNQEEEKEEKKLPELSEGQAFDGVQTKLSEYFTSPPKHFTEDLLLSAMERAGAEDMGDDVERKGLGTPATRADIIEKLVKDGFVKREKKQIIPTEDGLKLITVLPDVVKSPKLTADWENALTLVAKGELPMEDFMADIENMVSELIYTYHEVSDGQKKMFAQEQTVLGACPNCGSQVVKGKFGAYCVKKCGMNVSRVMGVALTDTQVKDLLAGKKILLKGLKSKAGKPYDAYIIPSGTEEYHYTKDGEEKSGVQFKFVMEFPKKKSSGGKKKKREEKICLQQEISY